MRDVFPEGRLEIDPNKGFASFGLYGPVIFDGLTVPDGFSFEGSSLQQVSFIGTHFAGAANFHATTFANAASFDRAEFLGFANFTGARFAQRSSFAHTRFAAGANFTHCQADTELRIIGCMIHGEFSMGPSSCAGHVTFAQTRFHGCATFDATTFHQAAIFSNCIFHADARFRDTLFHRNAAFNGTRFHGAADFSSAPSGAAFGAAEFLGVIFHGFTSFTNRAFKGITVFREARFDEPPEFFNVKLPHEADFERATYGKVTRANAHLAEPAYRTLKLKMSELQHHRLETAFFALELRAKRYNDSSCVARTLYALYCAFSNFGQSFAYPLLWLLGVAAMSGLIYFAVIDGPTLLSCGMSDQCKLVADWSRVRHFAALAVVGLVPFLEFPKQIAMRQLEALTGNRDATSLVLTIESVETVLSLLFLFLLGLALRNLFRLK
jgi:uncharacterized protein YjbI with pentapeptide repeats